jgi:hypothetical protein
MKQERGLNASSRPSSSCEPVLEQICGELKDCCGLDERSARFISFEMYRSLADFESQLTGPDDQLGVGKPII